MIKNCIPCDRYTVDEDMEIIQFISKNNLHSLVLGTKMYKWAAVSFSKEKIQLIGFIISERRGGTGEDKEVLCGPEAPVHLEDPEKLGQLRAPDGGVGEISGGSDDALGKRGKDETRI